MRRVCASAVATVAAIVVLAPATQAAPELVPTIVTCGTQVTRSILVVNSLWGCPMFGLVVTKPGLIVDLGGNTIDGDGVVGWPTTDIGVADGGHDRVVVRNGVVRGFDYGVTLHGDDSRAIGITATDNAKDGFYLGGQHSALSRSYAFANDVNGVRASANKVLIAGNKAWSNGESGFDVSGARVTLRGNSAWVNKQGFDVAGGAGVVIERNAAYGNAIHGFDLTGTALEADANTSTANGQDGFVLHGDGGTYVANTARGNGADGFDLWGRVRMIRNSATGNGVGIRFSAGADQSRLTKNRGSGNRFEGFKIAGNDLVLRENTAIGNGTTGFYDVVGDTQKFFDNAAHLNGYVNGESDDQGLGFRIDGAVTALSARGNKAWGNDSLFFECSDGAGCVKTNKPARLPTIVSCSHGVSKSIAVANSLFDCQYSGLFVQLDSVTIDLRGNTIDGNDIDDTPGVESGVLNFDGFSDVVVRNGTVTGFEAGVRLYGPALEPPQHNRIQRIAAFGNTDGFRCTGRTMRSSAPMPSTTQTLASTSTAAVPLSGVTRLPSTVVTESRVSRGVRCVGTALSAMAMWDSVARQASRCDETSRLRTEPGDSPVGARPPKPTSPSRTRSAS